MIWLSVLLASVLHGLALWLAWCWILPMIRQFSHRPIEANLCRARQLGMNADKLRMILFATESLLLTLLAWLSFSIIGLTLGLTMIAIGYHFRSLILDMIIDARERVMRRQTYLFASGLSGLVRSGLGLSESIDTLVAEAESPLGNQISKIAADYHRGRPLAESLNAVRSAMRLDAFSLLATAITCALKQGSSLGEALVGVRESLEHRDHAERQMTAKTANARRTMLILACTPPFFFLLFWTMQPESMRLVFTTVEGKRMLAAVLASMYIGLAWAKHLVTIK